MLINNEIDKILKKLIHNILEFESNLYKELKKKFKLPNIFQQNQKNYIKSLIQKLLITAYKNTIIFKDSIRYIIFFYIIGLCHELFYKIIIQRILINDESQEERFIKCYEITFYDRFMAFFLTFFQLIYFYGSHWVIIETNWIQPMQNYIKNHSLELHVPDFLNNLEPITMSLKPVIMSVFLTLIKPLHDLSQIVSEIINNGFGSIFSTISLLILPTLILIKGPDTFLNINQKQQIKYKPHNINVLNQDDSYLPSQKNPIWVYYDKKIKRYKIKIRFCRWQKYFVRNNGIIALSTYYISSTLETIQQMIRQDFGFFSVSENKINDPENIFSYLFCNINSTMLILIITFLIYLCICSLLGIRAYGPGMLERIKDNHIGFYRELYPQYKNKNILNNLILHSIIELEKAFIKIKTYLLNFILKLIKNELINLYML